jgi:predicted AAA+ superfamily ATPase
MINRRLAENLESALREFPVVGLVGPRQAGKTTLAKALEAKWPGASLYLDMERPSDLVRLSSGTQGQV